MEFNGKLEEKILGLIAEGIPGKFKKVKLTPETNLQKELGLDSIGMLALVFRFEEVFGIDIAQLGIDINVAKLRTVGDLLQAGRDILTEAESKVS
ncbi:MAG TPA: phosphopantetheine-binding protein [Candidatus Angelobacter sp.]|jgi:acyl carrier protein|nr:phosphopantetheine-binding protein [Candidatus Angelobacter sp.]